MTHLRALTFQKARALFDVGAELLKDAVDFLLGGDEVLERGSVHLRHESLVLFADCTGVGPQEN